MIPTSILDRMIAQARDEFPNEACGLLAKDGESIVEAFPIRNADASPVHYTLDPAQQLETLMQIDDRNWDLAAIYHSHTHTRAYPSPTDVRFAQVSNAFYPDVAYVIISLADSDRPDVRAFRIQGEEISEEQVETE